jgi:hypothetical protein
MPAPGGIAEATRPLAAQVSFRIERLDDADAPVAADTVAKQDRVQVGPAEVGRGIEPGVQSGTLRKRWHRGGIVQAVVHGNSLTVGRDGREYPTRTSRIRHGRLNVA